MTKRGSCRDAALLGPLLNGGVARWRDATSLSLGVTELRELEVAGRRAEDRVELIDELLN